MRELWLDFLALLWPTQCVVCAASDRDLCDRCRADLLHRSGSVLRVRAPVGVDYVAAGLYEGALRALLVKLKHEGRIGFARELGAQLVAPLQAALALCEAAAPVLLVTAPSRRAKVRSRGYRHVDLVVRAALRNHQRSSRFTPQLVSGALVARRGRTGQVGLRSVERQRNAERVRVGWRHRRRLAGAQVVLIDDIVTTGATVAAARKTLEDAGAHVIAVAALCTVSRRDQTDGRRRGEEDTPSPSLAQKNDGKFL